MRSIFILIIIFFFSLGALKSRYIALLMYWWFAIFRPQDWIWWDVSSYRLPLVTAMLLVIPTFIQKQWPSVKDPLAKLMVGWLLIALIAHFLNGCLSIGPMGESMRNISILILIVLITERLITSEDKLFGIVAIVGLSLAFHSGKGGLYALMTGSSNYGAVNLTGIFTGSNAYALGSALLLFFMIFVAQAAHNKESIFSTKVVGFVRTIFKYGVLLAIFGTIYNIISLSSRGSSLALAVGLIIWVILHAKKYKILSIVIPILFISLPFIPIPDGFEERISSVFVDDGPQDKSAKSRPHFWATASSMALNHPLGIGPGCYAQYYDSYDSSGGYFGIRRSVHSSHFQVLSETGYIGIILWAFLFIISYRKLWRIRKRAYHSDAFKNGSYFMFNMANTLICTQTVFLLGGAFYEQGYNDIIWLVWGLVIATEKLQLANIEK